MMANDESMREVPKRPRPVVSCLNCRRKKLKCDRTLPCQQCSKSGISKDCAYAPGCEPDQNGTTPGSAAKKRRFEVPNQSLSPSTEVSSPRFDELQARVKQLEQALQTRQVVELATEVKSSPNGAINPTSASASSNGQDPVLERLPPAWSSSHAVTKFPAVDTFATKLGHSDCAQELSTVAADIKALHEVLRPSPVPILASYTNKLDVLSHMQHLIPEPLACKVLVDLYFEYFENCFRILHKPSSMTIFQGFWNNTLAPHERNRCLPVLLCVVSIASSLGTLAECHQPSLQGEYDGIGAYQLIRNYLQQLKLSEWEELFNIQIAALSLGLHHSCPLLGTDVWLWSGRVLRRAMAAGIHDYTSTTGDTFEAEVHRRLWSTLLEQDLAISIANNMPPNCPTWQGPPPMNIEDDEIQSGMMVTPRSRDSEDWTDSICQHILAQSFNDRLEAYSIASSGKSIPYTELLNHTRRLEQVLQDLPRCFRFGLPNDASNTPSRLVAQMAMDFLLRRPLIACYAPWAARMPANDKFKEARILWIQSCTFGACFQDLFDPKYPLVDLPHPEGLWDLYHFVFGGFNVQFLLANCLELQRLWSLDPNVNETVKADFVNHTLRSKVKVPGWTIESIIKSIEEQIDAFIRRVGRPKSSLRVVVRWVAILGCLRVDASCNQYHSMKNELQSLVATLRTRFAHKLDAFEGQVKLPSTGSSDTHQRLWLQRYLLEDIDDLDLDNFPESAAQEEENIFNHPTPQWEGTLR